MPYIKKYLNSYEYCFKKDGKIIHEDRASRDFIALVEKVGLTDIGLHTLRHTFISQCLMAGISIWEVAKWVGHSTAYMTELYGHLCPSLDFRIERARGIEPPYLAWEAITAII
ncbi:MAG: hypothetical protein DPW17_14740 [Candidatus Jettenia sp.]|nr:hypothetical protein [Candidatus Jettenia sp.]